MDFHIYKELSEQNKTGNHIPILISSFQLKLKAFLYKHIRLLYLPHPDTTKLQRYGIESLGKSWRYKFLQVQRVPMELFFALLQLHEENYPFEWPPQASTIRQVSRPNWN